MTTIRKIDPANEPKTVNAIAGVYRKAFGGEPWNEGYKCPVCERKFPLSHEERFCGPCYQASMQAYKPAHCHSSDDPTPVLLVEYWPKQKVISDFYREMTKPEAICMVAEIGKNVAGFTWCYKLSVNSELDSHLEAPGLHKKLARGDFTYLDEVAVVPSHQGKGIGKELVKAICREHKQGRILLRTLDNSRMCKLIKNMGGEIVQHISKGRVIMVLYIK